MKTIIQIMGHEAVEHFLAPHSAAIEFGPASNQILGVEVETERLQRSHGWYSERLFPNWTVTQDNSLRGASGEFVTIPMKASNLLPALQNFYSITGFTEENFTDRCSIHVHANVQDFTVDQLVSLTLMYQTVEDIFFEFVGHWRDTNLYCIPWSQCRMSYKMIPSMLRSDGAFIESMRGWQKYTALNLLPILNQGTVEFRHMHGTADMDKISTWVKMISHLMYAAKSSTFEEVLNTVKDLNTSSQYQRWFERILGGVLPYDDRYRAPLFQGIVNAKYSFLTLDPKKPSKKGLDFGEYIGTVDVAPQDERATRVQGAAERVLREALERNRAEMARWTIDPLPNTTTGGWNAVVMDDISENVPTPIVRPRIR